MSIELLTELEDKIGSLIKSIGDLKAENASLIEAVAGAESLRRENDELKRQLEEARADADGQRGKMGEVADRVRDIIAKLDSAQ